MVLSPVPDGAEPVCDYYGCAACPGPIQCCLDHLLAAGVQGGCGLVQQQDLRVPGTRNILGQGPGEGSALFNTMWHLAFINITTSYGIWCHKIIEGPIPIRIHFLLSFLHSLYFPVETIMIESPGYSNLSLYLTRALAMAILCFCPLYLSPCT